MTSRDKFQVVGDSLVGRGLAFSVATLGPSRKELEVAIVDVVEAVYRQGRDSALQSYDDRYDLHTAVEVLRALAVVVGVGTPTADRYRRCADVIGRMLHAQEQGE